MNTLKHVILIAFAVLALTAALVAPRCSVTHRNGRAWLVCPRNGAYLYEDWYAVPLWTERGKANR